MFSKQGSKIAGKSLSWYGRGNISGRLLRGLHFSALEPLESRLLLSITAFTWTGGANDHLWSTPGNWDSVAGGVPDSTSDTVFFVSGTGSDWVDVDNSYTVCNLSVEGGANIDLDFDAGGNTLAITQNVGEHVGGYLYFLQTAGADAALTISNDGAGGGGAHDAVKADHFEILGDVTGWSDLFVNANNAITFAGDVDTTHYLFNLYDHGSMEALDFYLGGKDLPAGPTVSTASIDGTLSVDGNLRVGGNGDSVLAVTGGGTVDTRAFAVCNGSVLGIQNSSQMTFRGDSYVGDPPSWSTFVPAAGLENEIGACVSVSDGGVLQSVSLGGITPGLWVQGGDGVFLIVDQEGEVDLAGNLVIGCAGSIGAAGPTALVDGNLSVMKANNVQVLNTNVLYDGGQIIVQNGSNLYSTHDLQLDSVGPLPIIPAELRITSARVWADTVTMGGGLIPGHARILMKSGNLLFTGAGHAMKVGDVLTQGMVLTDAGLSCAPKMTPLDHIDFPARKGRKSDEEAVYGRADRGDAAGDRDRAGHGGGAGAASGRVGADDLCVAA